MHAVGDERARLDPEAAQDAREIVRLADTHRIGGGDDEKSALVVAQDLLGRQTALAERREEALECGREVHQLRHEPFAERAGEHLHGEVAGAVFEALKETALLLVGVADEKSRDLVREERGQAGWCVEEVERVDRGRRIEDDEVIAAVLHQAKQLLHGHVFVGAAELARDDLIEAVLE